MRTFLSEQEQIYSEQHAKELLAIQANYNKKLKQLNTELAKQKSDLMIKHMKIAQQQAAAAQLKQKTKIEPQQQVVAKTGTVDTAGNPVTSKGGTPAVESINILRVNPIDEDEQIRYGNPGYSPDMRNWYEKPVTGGHKEEKPKEKRKKEMTYKRRMEIQDLQYEIQDFKDEIKWTKEKFETPSYEGIEGEIENFFAEIGHDASEILNSGAYKTDAEKIKALKEAGVEDAKGTLETYYYYYPEFDPKLAVERRKSREQIRKLELEIQKRQDKIDKMYSMYESLNEATFSTRGVKDEDYFELKNYLDAENISYFEDEDGTEIDFDDTELDAEWRDRLEEIGLEYVRDFEDEEPKTDDILSIEDDEDITDKDQQIDEEKVFYVKVEDEGEAFIGKIYKLFDEGDWRSKIVDGESETFEKLNYDPDWDEFDIIAFLRENYADAELVSEDEFNGHVEDPEVAPEEVEESVHAIPTLDDFLGEASKSLDGEYPNKGDQFEILAEFWPGNPYNHLSLDIGTSVSNRSGNDKYEFKIGDVITYVSDNQWDTSFWKISDGREGRIFALPRSLVKKKIIKKIRSKFYR